MSSIVYQTNKTTGITYAYESISYWDKEKQQPRSKRRYLGRVDPETKEIIPKKEKRSKRKASLSSEESKNITELLDQKDQVIAALREEVIRLQNDLSEKNEALEKIKAICGEIQ